MPLVQNMPKDIQLLLRRNSTFYKRQQLGVHSQHFLIADSFTQSSIPGWKMPTHCLFSARSRQWCIHMTDSAWVCVKSHGTSPLSNLVVKREPKVAFAASTIDWGDHVSKQFGATLLHSAWRLCFQIYCLNLLCFWCLQFLLELKCLKLHRQLICSALPFSLIVVLWIQKKLFAMCSLTNNNA